MVKKKMYKNIRRSLDQRCPTYVHCVCMHSGMQITRARISHVWFLFHASCFLLQPSMSMPEGLNNNVINNQMWYIQCSYCFNKKCFFSMQHEDLFRGSLRWNASAAPCHKKTQHSQDTVWSNCSLTKNSSKRFLDNLLTFLEEENLPNIIHK